MQRGTSAYRNYLIYPSQWTVGPVHAYLKAGYEKGYKIKSGYGKFIAEMRSGGTNVTGMYANIRMESLYKIRIKKFDFRYRLFGMYTHGSLPLESALYLAGGNPEDMYDNDFYRARGFFPNAWANPAFGAQTGHLQYGGGLNLRGYNGYQAEFSDKGPAWYGNSGAALNLELDFDNYIPLHPKKLSKYFNFDSYLFLDAGVIGRAVSNPSGFDKVDFSAFRMDAGIGTALKISEWHFLPTGPLTIRCDFPLWLSRPPYLENNFAFRWLIGIERAF